jgi:hypothetical protein
MNYEEQYKKVMESLAILQPQLDAALQKHKDDAAAHAAAISQLQQQHAAALEAQAAQLREAYNQRVEALKSEFLIPALNDLHSRQVAELTAKQLAQMDKLKAS